MQQVFLPVFGPLFLPVFELSEQPICPIIFTRFFGPYALPQKTKEV